MSTFAHFKSMDELWVFGCTQHVVMDYGYRDPRIEYLVATSLLSLIRI